MCFCFCKIRFVIYHKNDGKYNAPYIGDNNEDCENAGHDRYECQINNLSDHYHYNKKDNRSNKHQELSLRLR